MALHSAYSEIGQGYASTAELCFLCTKYTACLRSATFSRTCRSPALCRGAEGKGSRRIPRPSAFTRPGHPQSHNRQKQKAFTRAALEYLLPRLLIWVRDRMAAPQSRSLFQQLLHKITFIHPFSKMTTDNSLVRLKRHDCTFPHRAENAHHSSTFWRRYAR